MPNTIRQAHRPRAFVSGCYDLLHCGHVEFFRQAAEFGDLRNTPEDNSQRMLNALEPGTVMPIHRHPTKDESFVILRGKVRSTTYNDDGSIIDSVVLSQEDGVYGVDISKGVWHKLESLEPNSVIFECKEGPFVPHEEDGILELPESRN